MFTCGKSLLQIVIWQLRMKKILIIGVAVMMSMAFSSCKKEKKSMDIITTKPVVKAPKKTQQMSNYVQMREVSWLGATYQVEVKRMSDATLDVVALEDGSKYFDNKISVRILRKDGSEFFKRVFTKADFLSYIDSGTKKHGALLGIVYVKAEGDWLFFAASVGSPDVTSDEYIPMVLKISRMGAVSISKDTQLDSAPSATASGQEEGGSEPMDDEDGEDGV